MNLFVFVLLLIQSISAYGFSIHEAGNCEDFTVGDCTITPDSILQTIPGIDIILCQETCRLNTDCMLWSHDGSICKLLNKEYRKGCGTVGAPVDADMDMCEDAIVESCSGFDEENCEYFGESIGVDPPDGQISDPLVCQQMCKTFSGLGCTFWVYKDKEQSCHLLKSADRACRGISGPRAPPIEDCGFWVVTTTQKPISCPKEPGYCVRKDGHDQNEGVIKLDDIDQDTDEKQDECLSRCLAYPGATGCEAIWNHAHRGLYRQGCYIHTQEVDRGNGAHSHVCWIFSKCTGY